MQNASAHSLAPYKITIVHNTVECYLRAALQRQKNLSSTSTTKCIKYICIEVQVYQVKYKAKYILFIVVNNKTIQVPFIDFNNILIILILYEMLSL